MLSTECVNDWCPDCRLANCLCPCHPDAEQVRAAGGDRGQSWRRVVFHAPPPDVAERR